RRAPERPCRDHVPRSHRRDRIARRGVWRSASSLHAGPARGRAGAGPAPAHPARAARGRRAQPAVAAARLRVPPALPARAGRLPAGHAAAGGGAERTGGRVPRVPRRSALGPRPRFDPGWRRPRSTRFTARRAAPILRAFVAWGRGSGVGGHIVWEDVRVSLGSDAEVTGKLSFASPTRVEGKLKGEIRASDLLVVGPQ